MIDFTAVIFDLDGVIVDSEPLHERAQRVVFGRYGIDVPAAFFQQFKGQTEEDVFEFAVRAFSMDHVSAADLVVQKHRVYETLIDDVEPVAGALPFIERLARRGVPLGLTTSATPENQRRVFDLFDLHGYFAAVVTVADVTRAKPHPEPYLTTAARLGVLPERCLVLEDSAHGVLAARRAGCSVAAVTTSFGAAQLAEAGAHLTFDRFEELARRLRLEADG